MKDLEFVPFNPHLYSNTRQKIEEEVVEEHEYFIQNSHHEQQRSLELNHRIPEERARNLSKKNHNLAKQLIITIKRMMNAHISFIQASPLRKRIIRQVWDIFYANKNMLNKQILMVMFNNTVSAVLAQKYGFKEIFKDHRPEQFKLAMRALKRKIMQVMTHQNIRSHLKSRRKIKFADQLIAYVDNFIKTQLRNDRITSRQNARTFRMISVLPRQVTEQQFFINSMIQQPIEVFSE